MGKRHAEDTHKYTGPGSLERAKALLEAVSGVGNIEQVSLELVYDTQANHQEDPRPKKSKSEDLAGGSSADDGQPGYKEINQGTSHHKALEAVKKLSANGPVSSSEVSESLEHVASGTVYAAMSDLYKRGMVEREERMGEHQSYYVYQITERGNRELDRLE